MAALGYQPSLVRRITSVGASPHPWHMVWPMAVRKIVLWPDPVLTKPADPVRPEELGAGFDALIEDMIESMYAADGLGLAAPQIGISKQIFVVDVPLGPADGEDDGGEDEGGGETRRTGPLVFVNPRLLDLEGETTFEEGCLSLPGLTVETRRATRLRVEALDARGETFERQVEGLFAIALQHEQDHLEGRLLVDRLSSLKRKFFRKKMLRLKEEEDA